MTATRSTRAFQMIALALVFSLAQVYVIGRIPTKANTDPKATDKSSASQPKAETVIEAEDRNATAPSAASEKMPLTAGTKTMLTRIFSKDNVEARIASGSSFINVKANAGNMFKTPHASLVPQSDDDGDDDDDGAKSTWIAVGVIAAVLTVVIIGLRMDRNRGN